MGSHQPTPAARKSRKAGRDATPLASAGSKPSSGRDAAPSASAASKRPSGRDATGAPSEGVASAHPEDKTLEEQLRDRTAQLEAANKELEAFCYSVSHDLRAPLRSIDGFTHALLESFGETLDPAAREYLDRVRAASRRMTQLIDDLLHLSRVSRREVRIQVVDLSEIAANVARELQKAHPDRQVELSITTGLHARADERLMRTVLENLLANAWKFTAKKERAHIQFGATEADNRTTFFVRDNGAGFEMTYADKLFTPFQRLHSPNEFPGSGIGLAIVQRIINRHGGRIWATSKPDEGATFFFTLPE